MSFRVLRLSLWAISIVLYRGACSAESHGVVSKECLKLNSLLEERISTGKLDEAQQFTSAAVASNTAPLEPGCAGLLLNDVATAMQVSGRLEEAVTLAERAVNYFEKSLAPDDPAYLAPLHVIASYQLMHGMTSRAREVLQRKQQTRVASPRDRALLHEISGAVLEQEGKWSDAETQYIVAVSEWSKAGKENSADAASLHGQLAIVYYQQKRYTDSERAVERALATLDMAPDAVPLDRIKLLNVRAAVRAKEDRWRDAATDLDHATSLARESKMDGIELEPVVTNYAFVLHKLHRKEARSIDAWAAALHDRNARFGYTVDLGDLGAAVRR